VAALALTTSIASNEAQADGLLRGWGSNVYGQLNLPQPVEIYASFAAGDSHAVALRPNGTVACWGRNQWLQCQVPQGLGPTVAVAAGGSHSLALLQDGSVQAWGYNADGQCNVPADLGLCQAISGGNNHSVALQTDGIVRCWGAGMPNGSGGSSGAGQSNVPANLGPCMAIAGAVSNTYAITVDGDFRGWGLPSYGVTTAPEGLGTIMQVDGGVNYVIALRTDGQVRCWGNTASPVVQVPADLGSCVAIAGGFEHCIALLPNGTVRSWGKNISGQTSVPARTYSVDRVDCGLAYSMIQLVFDCDGDGIADANQLHGADCNGNLVPDACDASQGFEEDCDGNGIADLCQSEMDTMVLSPIFSPIGWSAPNAWIIQRAAPAAQDVALSIQGRGDFAGLQEYVRVVFGSGAYSVDLLAGTVDCGSGVPWATVTVPYAAFNQAIAPDGSLSIAIQPSVAVDPGLCTSDTWVQLRMEYVSPLSSDCNGNGLLDSCEIADGLGLDLNGNGVLDDCESAQFVCPADIDGDGVVGGADLGLLLANWGRSDSGADLNGDGSVDGQDLGAFLGAWGACE